MATRVYWESLKKKVKAHPVGSSAGGLGSLGLFTFLFFFLFGSGAISNLEFSGDQVCEGTVEDPCYAYINFTAKEDIFLYPINYDPWGRNTPFTFDPVVKDWKLQRSWGNGWRDIPLNKSCTGTWCGGKPDVKDNTFSYAFRKGKDYQLRLQVYKYEPSQEIKWWSDNLSVPDPVWKSATGDYKVVSKGRQWIVKEKQSNHKLDIKNLKDPDSEICINKKENIHSGIMDKNYGNRFEGKKDKKTKSNCYKPNKGETYIRFGDRSTVLVYQDINVIEFNPEENLNIFAELSTDDIPQTDVWVKEKEGQSFFGANTTANITKNMTYLFYSNNSKVIKQGVNYFFVKDNSYYKVELEDVCVNNHTYDYYNSSIDEFINYKKLEGFCTYETYTVNDTSYLKVDFLDTDGLIDPTFTYTDVTTSSSETSSRVRTDSDYTHLEIEDNSILVYYPFDLHTTTVYDFSSNDNDATNNEATFVMDGYINNSYDFDGINDYMVLPSNVVYEDSGAVSVWFKADSQPSNGGYIFAHRTSGYDNRVYLRIDPSSKDLICNFVDFVSITSNNNVANDGSWHNAVITWDTDGAECFLDGTSLGTYDATLPGTANQVINLGTALSDTTFTYQGMIDETTIFNRTLTSTEVADIYDSTISRFYSEGNQTFSASTSLGPDYNAINVTLNSTTLNGTSFSGRVLQSSDNTVFTESSSGRVDFVDDKATFYISTSSEYFKPIIYYKSPNNFYSPVLFDVFLETYTSSEAPSNSCVYNSGDFIIDCSDDCTIDTNYDIGGNDIIFTGTGTITLTSELSNYNELSINKGTSGFCTLDITTGALR